MGADFSRHRRVDRDGTENVAGAGLAHLVRARPPLDKQNGPI